MADGQGGGGGGGGSYSPYGWGQSSSGFLGGFLDESESIRQRNQRENEIQQQVEQRALEHLATADDPQIKAAAVTAMLTPRKAGPGVFAKWYGQQQSHPLYEQVQQLIGGPGGKSPWLSIREREAEQTGGAIEGKLSGMAQGYSNVTGSWPEQATVDNWMHGMSGGPQRTLALQHGTIVLEEPTATSPGKTIPGYFDPASGGYFDMQKQPVTAARRFVAGGSETNVYGRPQTPGAGGTWYDSTDENGKPMRVHLDAYGRVMALSAPAVAPNPPPPTFMQTPGGVVPVNRGGGPGGGPSAGKPIPGTQDTLQVRADARQQAETALRNHVARMREIQATVLQNVRGFGNFTTDKVRADRAAALDQAAQAAGYGTWQEMVVERNRLEQAVTAVGGQIDQGQGLDQPQEQLEQGTQIPFGSPPPGGITPTTVAPAGRGAAPAGATAPRGRGTTPPAGRGRGGAGAGNQPNQPALPRVDVNAVIEELDRRKAQQQRQRGQQPQP